MPCDYKEYPENWKWLSRQIISDAGDKCELCYAPNRAIVFRDKADVHPWRLADVLLCDDPDYKCTKIVLTVHHINHDKKDNTKQNLIALCQRCHCRLDLATHMKNAAATRFKKKTLQEKQFSLEII